MLWALVSSTVKWECNYLKIETSGEKYKYHMKNTLHNAQNTDETRHFHFYALGINITLSLPPVRFIFCFLKIHL